MNSDDVRHAWVRYDDGASENPWQDFDDWLEQIKDDARYEGYVMVRDG